MLSFEKLRNTPPLQRPGAQAKSMLSSEILAAPISDDAPPLRDRETRQRMLKEELNDLQEALRLEKKFNRGTEKFQGRKPRSGLENQDDEDWDIAFEFRVW